MPKTHSAIRTVISGNTVSTAIATDPRMETIAAFSTLAKDYCDWCEQRHKGRDPGRIAAQWLSRLNEGVLSLPKVSWREKLPLTPHLRDLSPRRRRRRAHLAVFHWTYRKVFDPDPQGTEEPLLGSVMVDLLGVYGDLSDGLRMYQNGYQLNACRHWVIMYENHWGIHVTGALNAIYFQTVWRKR